MLKGNHSTSKNTANDMKRGEVWQSALILISVVAFAFVPVWLGWYRSFFDIKTDLEAARIEAKAAAIQLAFAFVLIAINIFLAVRNHQMTSATQEMAITSRKQLFDSSLPVIALSISGDLDHAPEHMNPFWMRCVVDAENWGGPALWVTYTWVPYVDAYSFVPVAQPFSLGNEGVRHFGIAVNGYALTENQVERESDGSRIVRIGELDLTYQDKHGRTFLSGNTVTFRLGDKNIPELRDRRFTSPETTAFTN